MIRLDCNNPLPVLINPVNHTLSDGMYGTHISINFNYCLVYRPKIIEFFNHNTYFMGANQRAKVLK